MNEIQNTDDDEIDLVELFAALAAQKLLIAAIALVAVLLSGVYAFRIAEPEYTAETVFSVARESGPALPSSAQGLAALAGLDVGGGENTLVFERLEGRDFILASAEPLGLYQDPVFNPALTPPGLKSRIIAGILGNELETPTAAKIDEALVNRFRERVVASETENGATELTVTHPDAERAALIANMTAERLFAAIEADELARARRQLDYFSDQLLEVQSDLDAALAAAQDFAVRSNIASEEELARKSSQLVNLRENRSTVRAQLDALDEFSAMLAGGDALSEMQVRRLQERLPVAESAEFLRTLGDDAIRGDWPRVSAEDVEVARSALSERLQRIERSIGALRKEAEQAAEEAAESTRLERDVKIEETTYELVLEQFRRADFASGFEDATGEVYSRAAAPLEPSEPRKALILALGMVLGLVSGSGIALVRMSMSGRLYTGRALRDSLSREVSVVGGQFLSRLKGRGWAQLARRAAQLDDVEASEFCFSLQQQEARRIIVTALDGPRQGGGLAALLADRLPAPGERTLIFDAEGVIRGDDAGTATDLEGIRRYGLAADCDLYRIDAGDRDPGRVFLDPGFRAALPAAVADYDRVIFLLPPLRRGKFFVEALADYADALVAVARLGVARRPELDKLSLLAREASMHTYLVTQRR